MVKLSRPRFVHEPEAQQTHAPIGVTSHRTAAARLESRHDVHCLKAPGPHSLGHKDRRTAKMKDSLTNFEASSTARSSLMSPTNTLPTLPSAPRVMATSARCRYCASRMTCEGMDVHVWGGPCVKSRTTSGQG